MIKLLYCVTIILCIQEILTQRSARRRPELPPETAASTLDPVSKILSDLSDFILDVDEAVARQIAPQVRLEDNARENIRRRPSRTDFFSRIQENYRNLQDRIGLPLGVPDDVSVSSDLFDINIKNKGQDIDVSVPLSPIKVIARSRNPLLKSTFDLKGFEAKDEDSISDVRTRPLDSRLISKTKIKEEIDDKTLGNHSPDTFTKGEQMFEKRSSRQTLPGISSTSKEPEVFIPDDDAIADLSTSSPDLQELVSTQSIESEDLDPSGLRGRILGDVLYSESTFDKITRRLLKDYGSLILDSDLSPSKIFDRLNKATRGIFGSDKASAGVESEKKVTNNEKIQTTTQNNLHTSDRIQTNKFLQGNVHKPMQSPKPMWDRVVNSEHDNIRRPENVDDLESAKNLWKIPTKTKGMKQTFKKRILLAFTPEGIPLKLKIPAELDNSLEVLHRILKTAGVSLNFPVQSYEDIEPSGTAILQLGVGRGGMNARTLNVDLTDLDQLDSFLKMLKSFKTNRN